MYNKPQKILFAIFVMCVLLYGCNLLSNQKPQQSIPYKKGSINSVKQLQNLLTGAYSDLQAYASTILYSNDMIADDAVFTGSFTSYQQIANRKMASTNFDITNMWDDIYKAINDANIILDNAGSVKGDKKTIDNIRGQALFIRSLEYYNLLSLWTLPSGAKQNDSQLGVPLHLKPVYSSDDFKQLSRSTVKQVYDKIVSDLKKAAELLSSQNSPDRATPAAATALRARIALIRHNYPEASKLAGKVIDSNNFELLPNVTDYFRDEGSAESIFEIKNTAQDPGGGRLNLSTEYNCNARDDIQINISYVNALNMLLNSRMKNTLKNDNATSVDTRNSELIDCKDQEGNIIVRKKRSAYTSSESNTGKYEQDIDRSDDIPVIRYPEMILTRAESIAHTEGINNESINLLNEIRERAFRVQGGPISLVDYKKADFTSKQELINAIFLERRVELSFEGHRKTDLQRLKRDVRGLPWDSPRLVFPIPQSQIESNPNIKQNPAYRKEGS